MKRSEIVRLFASFVMYHDFQVSDLLVIMDCTLRAVVSRNVMDEDDKEMVKCMKRMVRELQKGEVT